MTAAWRSPAVAAWEARGHYRQLGAHRVFVVDLPAVREAREPLLVLHGFPTSSFDFHLVAEDLSAERRVVLLDYPGYGLSDKPDVAWTVDQAADAVAAVTAELGLDELSLLTHDVGDTVGGELLARQEEGRWPVEVHRRVLSNGSIYIGLAHLSSGQELLLSLPDERLEGTLPFDEATMAASLKATFAPGARVGDDELAAMCELVMHHEGHRLLPRLIRYIEERRRNEGRFTGAIEHHPSPLSAVWGTEDPIAVVAMVDRLVTARPDTKVTPLDGVGHYPMVEAPAPFAAAVLAGLG